MFFVMLAWVAQVLLLSGIGWAFNARIFKINSPDGWNARDFFRSFWVGFGVLVAVAQVATLLVPLSGKFMAVVMLAALPGLWWQAQAFRTRPVATRVAGDWTRYLFWGVLVLCVVRAAAGSGALEWNVHAYDSDLYHLNSVRWAKEFPVVPGLANLHVRLGLSCSTLLYAAIVDHGPWYGRSAWIVPGVFIVMLVAQLLWTLLRDGAAARHTKIFCLLLLAFAVMMLLELFPSLYFDRPAMICLSVALLELLQLAPQTATPRETFAGLCVMLLLAAVSVTIKPLGAVATAFLALAAVVMAWRLPQRTAVLRVFALPVLLAVGLLARNAMLSGWLLFPAPYGRLPVEWALPEHASSQEPIALMQTGGDFNTFLRGWARQPGAQFAAAMPGNAWQWLPYWWQCNGHTTEFKLLAAGIIFLPLALLFRRRREPSGWLPFAILLTGANLAAWFFSAPTLRFGEGYFWLWFALTGALLLARLPAPRATFALGSALAALALWSSQPGFGWPEKVALWRVGHALAANCHTVELSNGQQPPLRVLVPDNDDRAGDAPLPNTPYPRDTLCARVPGAVRHGFFIAAPASH